MHTSLKSPFLSTRLVRILLLASLASFAISRAKEHVLWRENFEGEANLWTADRGVWQFGKPEGAGAPTVPEGTNIAGVGLRGNYPNGVKSSFIRDEYFLVPPASQNPRLRFLHWFNSWLEDYGQVYVLKQGSTNREPISQRFSWRSEWTKTTLSLAKYAGEMIRVEFYFESNNDNFLGRGWFIDDIALIVWPDQFTSFENFDGPTLWSFNEWTATLGNWQITEPAGPRRAYSGSNCAALSSSGDYPNLVRSSFVGPRFVVPPSDQNPQLRFYHAFDTWSTDIGEVHIWEEGPTNIVTNVISPRYWWASQWSRGLLPLGNFENKTVRIALYFNSDNDNFLADGWFVDDLQLWTGDYEFRGAENFETDAPDWAPTRGNWYIGTPTVGPRAAFSGTKCASVGLTGNYPNLVDSALVSPPFEVLAAEQNPRLRFQHWFNIQNGDYGVVRVRDDSGTNEISQRFSGSSDWSRITLPLTNFGKRVQIEFYFFSNNDNFLAPGWFIDDIEIIPAFPNRWPVLEPIGTQIASSTGLVSFPIRATDPDFGQTLTFSLDPATTPDGAVLTNQTSTNATFFWDPTAVQRATNAFHVRVRVTDNGTPPRSTSELVPILMPGSIQLETTHPWEPFHVKVGGAAPGLDYTSYVATNLVTTNSANNGVYVEWAMPGKFVPTNNFTIRSRGEAAFFPGTNGLNHSLFFIKGEKPVGP